jgi:hypothetical protein
MAAGETNQPHGSGTMGSEPTQGVFIGWLAIGMLALMAVFTIAVLAGAMMAGPA